MRIQNRIAETLFALLAAGLCGCATTGAPTPYGAYGYLSPGDDEGDFIGAFDTLGDCEAAAREWESRQVVGNPVRAECYPVDHH